MKSTQVFSFAILSFGLAVAGGRASAQTLSGTLSNFDVFNETGEDAHGFEIQLEGLNSQDVTFTFGGTYIRYGDPRLVEYPGGVIVRYQSAYNAGAWSVATPKPPAPPTATAGHSCWAGGAGNYLTSGCEHFGVGLARNPTSIQYRWLVEDHSSPGALSASASIVNIPAAFWNVAPVAGGGAPVVEAHVEAPHGGAGLKGDAFWVKVYENESSEVVALNHLMTDDPAVPTKVEAEWELFQYDPKKPDKSVISHSKSLGSGNKSVIRRFEFYKYTGAYTAEHEASCGKCAAPAAGELGAYVGAQMAAALFGVVNAPRVAITAVANSASGQAVIQSGSWVSIYGTNLSATSREWRASDFAGDRLPTDLDGVRVSINGKPAAVAYISPTQINAQAPSDAASGQVQVQVTNASGIATGSAQLQSFAPGFFTFQGKHPAAVHVDGMYLAPAGFFGAGASSRPAKPGETVLVFGSGFGPTSPAVPAGQLLSGAAPLADPSQLHVRIGGVEAVVKYAGLVGVGEYQINVVVPALPDGVHPIVADIGGVSTQAGLTLAVQN